MTVRGRIMEAANRTVLILELKRHDGLDWIGFGRLHQKLTRTTTWRTLSTRVVVTLP
jgi:hypothetical protein